MTESQDLQWHTLDLQAAVCPYKYVYTSIHSMNTYIPGLPRGARSSEISLNGSMVVETLLDVQEH